MNIDEQLTTIKKKLEDVKSQKVANATKLKGLEDEKAELLRECKLLDTDPQLIEEKVKEQEEKVQKELEEVTALLKQFDALGS